MHQTHTATASRFLQKEILPRFQKIDFMEDVSLVQMRKKIHHCAPSTTLQQSVSQSD